MYRILNMRVYLHHLGVKLRMLAHHYRWIKSSGYEDGVDATRQRRCEDVADLESNEKGKCDDYRGKITVVVVGWFGEDQVEVR